ncbi:MAG TPA: bifunctional phosphoribosylaminoimidazolecarboxamide formyltransferase/IMP cyclohydrolase [Gammaproteobacteria bacterium]|nr:bifunctional phosphoribosylaminoimidazolecarboxamide formyltransferase/IMP cyclohydrolase [Gammaproteobacteria bacterium]
MSPAAPRRAVISVSEKKGLVPFAEELAALEFELVSTGGTARLLREAGLTVTGVSEVTGFPEIMDGRVKTLHPKIHGGLLARAGIDDAVAAEHGIGLIDLVVVNLYPFASVIADPKSSYVDAVENIDIGGPAMIRAAAKNHARVLTVVDVSDYEAVLDAFRQGEPSLELRKRLSAKAFAHTAAYDAMIADYLEEQSGDTEEFPERMILSLKRKRRLRYGENPHQKAAAYSIGAGAPASVIGSLQLQGKELSFNNLADADTALRCVLSFAETACVIVKHANPCGVGQADTPADAYAKAYEADPTSAFGGVIAFNRELDQETAAAILDRQFVELIVAPRVAEAALSRLAAKPDVRVLAAGQPGRLPRALALASIEGGALVQEIDRGSDPGESLDVVTRCRPTAEQSADLRFAWRVVQFVKSNAIVFAARGQTLGIGAGQMSRIMSTRIAAWQAAGFSHSLDQAVLASDAFFPFRDNVDLAAEHGIRAIIQPGGSRRDDEVIAAADELGIVMVFTGHRHFRH